MTNISQEPLKLFRDPSARRLETYRKVVYVRLNPVHHSSLSSSTIGREAD